MGVFSEARFCIIVRCCLYLQVYILIFTKSHFSSSPAVSKAVKTRIMQDSTHAGIEHVVRMPSGAGQPTGYVRSAFAFDTLQVQSNAVAAWLCPATPAPMHSSDSKINRTRQYLSSSHTNPFSLHKNWQAALQAVACSLSVPFRTFVT